MDYIKRIRAKDISVGIIGLGYVGLPLTIEFCRAGFHVTGFDVDGEKIRILQQGNSYIKHISSEHISKCLPKFSPTSDFSKLAHTDCVIICVPTPLNQYREPDLSFVLNTTKIIAYV